MNNRLGNIFDPIEHELDQSVFRGTTPRPSVVKFIKDKFFDKMGELVANPQFYFQLVLTGSLTTYQYSETSDCDVSVIPDYDALARTLGDPNEVRRQLVRLVTSRLDGTFLPGTQHPLQYFVLPYGDDLEVRFAPGVRSGYDIMKKEWINPPEADRAHNVEVELPELYGRAEAMADKMRLLLDGGHDDEARQLFAQIHAKRSLDENEGLGDFSEGNIVYKYLLHEGFFDKLRGIGVKIAWNPFKREEDELQTEHKLFDPFSNKRIAFFVMPDGSVLTEGSWHADITHKHPDAPWEALFAGSIEGGQYIAWGSGSYGLMPTDEQIAQYEPIIQEWAADEFGLEVEVHPWMRNAAAKLYYHVAPVEQRESIQLRGLDPEFDQTGYGAVFLDTKPTWSGEGFDTWRVIPRSITVEGDVTTPGMGWHMTYDRIPPEDLELLDQEDLQYVADVRTAKTRIVYNFDKDFLLLTDDDMDDHIKEADHIIVGTYGDGEAHLNNEGKQFLNANYFKRLWINSFPGRELKNVHVDGNLVPTRDKDMMTYTQKNPIVVHNPEILAKIGKDPWRKGKNWRDFIKNKGIIVEFQMGDKKEEKFDGRVQMITKDSITVEVAPGESRKLEDELLDSIKFRVRDDKRSLSKTAAARTANDVKLEQFLNTYDTSGCFGYIGGSLLLGSAHHQEIMAALLEAGWTWEQLMYAPQAWGWYEMYVSYGDGDNWYEYSYDPAEARAKKSTVELNFASDAGVQNKTMAPKVRQAFRNLTGIHKIDDYGGMSGIENRKENYGLGLSGDRATAEQPGYGSGVQGVIPPPPVQ